MTDRLYIDGYDAYSEYGVFVTEGGYNELMGYAPLKSVPSNNWQEEDGVEFDLSAPVLDSRELSINFAAHGSNYELGRFMEMLSDKAYHWFELKNMNRKYRLRLMSESNLALNPKFGIFTLRFADDFPLSDYKYVAPQSDIIPIQGYEIDGIDMSQYGVRILEGSLTEIEKSPAVKNNLLRNIKSKSGAIYDGEVVAFETKDVNINCLMRANTLSEFWQNYDALLFDLIRPEERKLYVDQTGYEYPCCYKSCSVSNFIAVDKIWLEFSLALTFTSFRTEGDQYILASEEELLIITENDDYLIDMKYGN